MQKSNDLRNSTKPIARNEYQRLLKADPITGMLRDAMIPKYILKKEYTVLLSTVEECTLAPDEVRIALIL